MAWGREKKGLSCPENEDGSVTCKRIVKTKDGQLIYDGQEVTIVADPADDCKPHFVGNLTVMDDEWGTFDEAAKRVSSGCGRKIKQGYS